MTGLLAQLDDLVRLSTESGWVGLLVFLRVGSMIALAPAFGEQVVPMRIRLVIGLAFTAVVAPSVSAQDVGRPFGLLGFGAEVVIGLMLGFGLRLFVMALQMAGAMAAQATSLSQMFGGTGPEPQPAVANLLVMGGLALAVALGLHIRLAELLLLSYQIFPVGGLPAPQDAAPWAIGQISHAFGLAFTLAAPFTLAALIYNIALGALNRAMPALMLSFIGAPALILGGMILMMLALPAGLSIWVGLMQGFMATPFGALP